MSTQKTAKKVEQKYYTLAEVKEKYFPNRKLSSLTNRDENTVTREAYLNILKKIVQPAESVSTKK